MKTICSHTLVRNGMPFVGLILRKVAPYMNRCLVTVSDRADLDTLNEIHAFKQEFGKKVVLLEEGVSDPAELTQKRQQMVELTDEDWILFLDDDDYWPADSLINITRLISLNNHLDGVAVRPIQVVGPTSQDWGWRYKWFTKWFPNVPGLHFLRPWPKDIIMINERPLYWRQNHRVLRDPHHFFHLSAIKDKSFRMEDWARPKWGAEVGEESPIREEHMDSVNEIYRVYNNGKFS